MEVVHTHQVGQVLPSLTSSDIAAAINRMLDDPLALAAMREHALEAACEEYCWEKERSRLLSLYQALERKDRC